MRVLERQTPSSDRRRDAEVGASRPAAATAVAAAWSERWTWAGAALVFAGSFAFRFLDPGLVNDHFRLLAQARQILDGEAPFRDFVDPGVFLQIYTSAAIQGLFGHNLLGEALLCIFFLSAGFALTFVLATEASRSRLIALLVTITAILLAPRLYSYDKVFLLVAGLLVCWRYVDRRTTPRLIGVALGTALAFLVRHDHGVYIGAASVAMLASAHWADGFVVMLRRLVAYGAAVVVALLPFLAFLQANGGAVEYFRSAVEYTVVRGEGKRTDLDRLTAFRFDPAADLFRIEPAPPPVSGRIEVRWVEEVSAERRAELERQYQLARANQLNPRRWQYTILDTSRPNVEALLDEPDVDDVEGVTRSPFHVRSGTDETLGTTLQRAIPPLRLRILPDLFQPANAIPWLYHLVVALPFLALVALIVRRLRQRSPAATMAGETPKIVCAAALCVVADYLLIRHPLEYRLADAATPTAVIAAWLLGLWVGPASRRAPGPTPDRRPFWRAAWRGRPTTSSALAALVRALRLAVAALLIGITWLSAVSVSDFNDQVEDGRVLAGPQAMLERADQVVRELGTTPPIDAWAPPGSPGLRALTRYVHECTAPTDRLLVTSFLPDTYFYAGRGFAGGQLFWFSGYYASPDEQRRLLEKLRSESVPIIIAEVDGSSGFAKNFELVHEHLVANYRLAAESNFGGARPFRVLVDARVPPTGTYQPLSLPCFR